MLKKLSVIFALSLCVAFAAALPRTNTHARPASADDPRPFYYTREIKPEDLYDRSLRELQLMRNTIFARAGNKFRKKWLNDYFSAQPWYHPLDKTDESKVTALDRKNAQIIANYDAAISRDGLLEIQRSITPDTPANKIEVRLASLRRGHGAG